MKTPTATATTAREASAADGVVGSRWRVRGTGKVLVRATVSLLVLGALFFILPWAEVRDSLLRLPFGIWAAVLVGFGVGHAVGVAKWRLIVNAGRSGLRAVDAIRCYAAGLFANLCLPSIVGGDVLRAALAARATGRPEPVVLGSIADRALDIAGLALLILVGGLFARGALPGWGATVVNAGLLLGIGGALVLLPLALRRPLRRWPAKHRRRIGRALVALRRIARRPHIAVIALGLSLAVQSGFVLLNAWIGRGVGITVPLAVWFLAWPLAKLVGLLPISLGGLGVRDAALAGLLVPLGVPAARSLVASLAWQTVLIAGGLIAGAIWRALSMRSVRQPAARRIPMNGREVAREIR